MPLFGLKIVSVKRCEDLEGTSSALPEQMDADKQPLQFSTFQGTRNRLLKGF
jgi:hypothetical protein